MASDDKAVIPALTDAEIERRKALPEAARRALEEADARKAKEAADAAAYDLTYHVVTPVAAADGAIDYEIVMQSTYAEV